MKLALDAMGGDHAPRSAVEGAVLFARAHPAHEVVLVGDSRVVGDALRRGGEPPANVSLHHASEVVGMDEHATASVRKKQDSSLHVCFRLMKEGAASAVVSAGNSGAVMAVGLYTVGRIRGVERPAIAALIPSIRHGHCLLLDAGANVECRASHLAQFAVMGEAYVRTVLGIQRPRIAVLANGEEASKGTALTREASELIARSEQLRFLGYVEGKDLFAGEVDVVVTDGFTGNVVLKTSEGAAAAVAGMIRNAVEKAGISERLGALLLQPTLAGLRRVTDYAEVGGAPLLGLEGVTVIAHGRSSAKAISNALRSALRTAEARVHDAVRESVDRASGWLPSRRQKGATDSSV